MPNTSGTFCSTHQGVTKRERSRERGQGERVREREKDGERAEKSERECVEREGGDRKRERGRKKTYIGGQTEIPNLQ
jgi:hypothetical protein